MEYEKRIIERHTLYVAKIENNVAGIYKIMIGSSVYIGSSKNIRRRLNEHIRKLVKGKHDNYKLQRAFNACDIEDIIYFSVSEIHKAVDAEKLFVREQHYIDKYRKTHTLLNVYDTADTRKIMSLRHRYGKI